MIRAMIGGVMRAILAAVGGNLAAQGWMTEDQVQQAIGAILTLGAIAWSIWQKSRTRTAPGGPFNPRAEIRRPKSYRLPRHRSEGSACPLSLIMTASIAMFCLSALHGCATHADVTGHAYHQRPCHRPFLARLMTSVRISPYPGGMYGPHRIYLPGLLITAGADF